MQNPVFALDIGTRTVVGILAAPIEGGRIAVRDAEAIEHGDRAMRDGQVHDIPEVGRRIGIVAERLASRNGLKLERAYVAAAGRALKTVEVEVALPVPRPGEISERLIHELEIAGVADAVGKLADASNTGRPSERFHCVGFSVVRYRLDGEEIANPLGQRGDRLEAAVIATFLPRIVTDGLVLSLRRGGLDIAGLTLEPIAAVNVAIGPTMRQLNLALVDIGAGTSDIALTREGAVTGFAMVPRAGDAMTEALAQEHLLDFAEAERLKKAYGGAASRSTPGEGLPAEVRFEAMDVLGLALQIGPSQLDGALQAPIADLSQRISREILQLNGRAPAAVVCIGGGSLTPKLAPAIAQRLGLPPARVGVRGAEMVKTVDLTALHDRPEIRDLLAGPSGVTPLGIAWGALYRPGFRFVEAWVRQRSQEGEASRVQVLDLGRATVLDALVAAGVPPAQLAGRPGLGMAVRIDGQIRLVPGTHAKPARVEVDGVLSSLDAKLIAGANIVYDPACDGTDATARLGDLFEAQTLQVLLNGHVVSMPLAIAVDGKLADLDQLVSDGAEITCDRRLGTVLDAAGYRLERQVVRYRLDGVWQELPRRSHVVRVDGVAAPREMPLSGGERIDVEVVDHSVPRVSDVVPEGAARLFGLYLNGQRIEVPIRGFRILKGHAEIPLDAPISDGDDLAIEPAGQPIVADLLALIQSELISSSGPGKSLELRVDGAEAQFTTPLPDGSRIEARWVEIPV